MKAALETIEIVACLVPEKDRMDFLPGFFGARFMSYGENLVYHWMTALSRDYNGGLWNYYTLANGGFYMAPETNTEFGVVAENYFEGKLSADAAGIVSTLYALGALAARTQIDRFTELYHLLLDYGRQHVEWSSIRSAID